MNETLAKRLDRLRKAAQTGKAENRRAAAPAPARATPAVAAAPTAGPRPAPPAFDPMEDRAHVLSPEELMELEAQDDGAWGRESAAQPESGGAAQGLAARLARVRSINAKGPAVTGVRHDEALRRHYPSREDWPHDDIGAGSFHDRSAWRAASDAQRYWVVEVQTIDATTLLRFARSSSAPSAPGIQPSTKQGQEFGRLFHGCVLAADRTYTLFPQAVGNTPIVLQGRSWCVIRPRRQFDEPPLVLSKAMLTDWANNQQWLQLPPEFLAHLEASPEKDEPGPAPQP